MAISGCQYREKVRKMEKKDELSQEQTIEVSCPYCGVSCDMDDNYCWKCGRRLPEFNGQ